MPLEREHKPVALLIPHSLLYYGACLAGDFYARLEHTNPDEARADVEAHVREMTT